MHPGSSLLMQTRKVDRMGRTPSPQAITEAIRIIEDQVEDPGKGLPEDVFLFVSRLTPLINVDLLIRDAQGQILLTWRDDAIFGQGWHVPGGCIRLGESFGDRISAVAKGELDATVAFQQEPLQVYHTVDKTRSSRTHHITLLFDCQLTTGPEPNLMHVPDGSPKAGNWKWHSQCPDDLLQAEYRCWFPAGRNG